MVAKQNMRHNMGNVKKCTVLLLLAIINLPIFISCSKDKNEVFPINPEEKPEEKPEIITKDSLKGAILDNYIEGTTSYMFSDGIAINLANDSIFGYRIAVDSLDINKKKWASEKGFIIYCDSTLIPIIAIDMNNAYHFVETSDKVYHVTRTDLNGNIQEELDNVSIKKESSSSTIQGQSRASTVEGNAKLEGISAALDIYDLVSLKRLGQKQYYKQDFITQKTQEELLSKRLSAFQDLLDNPYINVIADIFSIAEGPMGILNFLVNIPEDYRAIVEDMVKNAIGDCTPYIQSVERISENTANVNIKFTNVVQNSKHAPFYRVFYWYEKAGVRVEQNCTNIQLLSEDGEVDININNLKGGKIGFQVCIFPDTYYEHESLQQLYCFRSNIEYLELDPLKIVSINQKDAVYANDAVKAKVEVQIGFLSDLDKNDALNSGDYGILMTQEGVQTKYSLKKEGKETIEIEVSLPRNSFIPFYRLFEASSIGDVSFCAYQSNILGEYYSDSETHELIYNKKPILITGSSNSVTENSAIVICEYKQTAFWTEKIGVEFCDAAGKKHEILQNITEDSVYNFQLTGLKPETIYTYRAFAIIDGKYLYADNSNSFITTKKFDVKDIEFEITQTFKESCPNTENLPYYIEPSWRHPRYLKFWYEVSTNDISKIQGLSKWGTILYKNGQVYDSYNATKDDWSFNVLRCDEADLTIHNSTYTAVADKATYAISIFVERTDSIGKTIFETTDPKLIDAPTYTQKPEIVISSIKNVYDTIISESDSYGIYYQLHCFLEYRAQGLFWVEPIRGNDEGIDIIHQCPLDEAYHGSGSGSSYYNNQRPQTIRITAKDLTTGKIITSNVINIP